MERLKELYTFHFKSERRERLFLASVGFLLTFGIVRGITHLIRAGVGPIHNMNAGGLHIHHLVWGILILIVVGYVWLVEQGVGSNWIGARSGPLGASVAGGAADSGAAVLSQGTVLPLPHSQKTIVPAEVSDRLCVLPHFLQLNQIMPISP